VRARPNRAAGAPEQKKDGTRHKQHGTEDEQQVHRQQVAEYQENDAEHDHFFLQGSGMVRNIVDLSIVRIFW
jgi:hypothetical protein